MILKFRIATPVPYEFIEYDYEPQEEMEPKAIRAMYNELSSAFKEKEDEGLPQQEWNKLLDEYRRNKGMQADVHEKLSKQQQWLIHELDKSNTRLAYRASKEQS